MSEYFSGDNILISGATGLIGRMLVSRFLSCKECRVSTIVRDREKATRLFGQNDNLRLIVSDICDPIDADTRYDHIIHCASVTDSKSFVEHPVEVIRTAYEGTRNMLEIARMNPLKSFIFLSSMEVYGSPRSDELIYEDSGCNVDTMKVRSAYPESKRLCETLCASYCREYGVPVRVLRLTQTFGKGVDYSDKRVFAEFARSVIEGRDIVLHTKGETKRSYLDVEDACSAIEIVMSRGKDGEAYNAANEDTYCSILEMAENVAANCAGGRIQVKIEENEDAVKSAGYADTLCMNLSCDKLKELGWKPGAGLTEMYNKMIEWMKAGRGKEDGN